MLVEGDKRKGRFIKQDSALFRKVTIVPFDFMEVCRKEVITKDNSNLNIIHKRLHEKEELDKAVEESIPMRSSLVDRDRLRPILKPRDFTDDWEEQKRRAKRRANNTEEEDFELEQQLLEEEEARDDDDDDDDHGTKPLPSKAKTEMMENLAPLEMLREDPVAEPESVKKSSSEEKLRELQSPQREAPNSIGIVDEAIRKMQGPELPPIPEAPITNEAPPSDPSPLKPEQEPRVEPQTKAAEGEYDAGFQKGLADAKDLIHSVGALVEELKGLKNKIMTNIQDNFYQLAKGLLEGLLEHQVKLNPEIIGRVIKRVVNDSFQGDTFKIVASPAVCDALSALPDFNLKEVLQKDESLEGDRFKVESKLAVVEGNLRDVVSKMLDNMDLSLFEPGT